MTGSSRSAPRRAVGMTARPVDPACARIRAVVARIPRGRVATYGQVAELAGLPRQPRRVGYALAALPDDARVPWQRVINAQGRISPRAEPHAEQVQRILLAREGVVFDARGRVALERFGWRPRVRVAAATRAGRRSQRSRGRIQR